MQHEISVDEMARTIASGLQDYANLADAEVKKAVRKTANSVKREISQNAPKKTRQYAKSWKTKVTGENSHNLEVTVYAGKYQIAHLLENGHAKRGGGRVEGIPHIAPAEENGEKLLQELIRKALS